jgi:hypothetical protein
MKKFVAHLVHVAPDPPLGVHSRQFEIVTEHCVHEPESTYQPVAQVTQFAGDEQSMQFGMAVEHSSHVVGEGEFDFG